MRKLIGCCFTLVVGFLAIAADAATNTPICDGCNKVLATCIEEYGVDDWRCVYIADDCERQCASEIGYEPLDEVIPTKEYSPVKSQLLVKSMVAMN
ncbi:MAG: hypothetical protein QM761_13620 [Pseudoxanthomonas sp.]